MRVRLLTLTLLFLGLLVATQAQDPKADDAKNIQGAWTVVGFSEGSKNWEETTLKAANFKVVLKDGKLALKKGKDAVDEAEYTLGDKPEEKSEYKPFDT